MPWYVYIAESRFRHFYTGITNNPELRILKHNSGKGSQMAIQQGPFILAYISKEFPDKSSARKREAQIKKWTKSKKDKLINGEWK
ncbi:MAG: GIY-YIG nuclease family protein [bacterium]|nr:GIY-YIG nuclease family protein [bacterium]